jgi:hypothetical protein
MLPRALDSLLRQKNEDGTPHPVKIIVADDGDCDRTDGILREQYATPFGSGQIIHLKTNATDAWTNWRAGAEAAETDFVCWLQDDDEVCDYYASRIVSAFDYTAAAGHHRSVWMGRLTCATHHKGLGGWGVWYASNGPFVPMEDLYGGERPCGMPEGRFLAPSMYLTAHSLSPALAYRNGPEFREALRRMPTDTDIFIERMLPAEMAAHGGLIADPVVIGHWILHDQGHLSRQQHKDQPAQTRRFVAHMDGLLDRLDGWQAHFTAWLGVMGPAQIIEWFKHLDHTEEEGGKSRHGKAIRELMARSLEGRVIVTPGKARKSRKKPKPKTKPKPQPQKSRKTTAAT